MSTRYIVFTNLVVSGTIESRYHITKFFSEVKVNGVPNVIITILVLCRWIP